MTQEERTALLNEVAEKVFNAEYKSILRWDKETECDHFEWAEEHSRIARRFRLYYGKDITVKLKI